VFNNIRKFAKPLHLTA